MKAIDDTGGGWASGCLHAGRRRPSGGRAVGGGYTSMALRQGMQGMEAKCQDAKLPLIL